MSQTKYYTFKYLWYDYGLSNLGLYNSSQIIFNLNISFMILKLL